MSEQQRRHRQQPIEQRNAVCVAGLGYVGLPVAIEMDRVGYEVIGYDVDSERIDQLRSGTDPTGEIGDEEIAACSITFTTDEKLIRRVSFVIVAVPTPIDDLKNPELKYVEAAGKTIGHHIQPETTVILESTVYPGATRTVFAPAIESTSGMTAGEDFFVGYSPERMVPGDDEHGLTDVIKIVSGQDAAVLEEVAELYGSFITAGVHRAPRIEVAEAAKCIENVQRDLNIALVNELAIACDALGLDTNAVLDAASTKWNFHEYRPGLVGGHCIPVDPFFIIFESKRNGFSPRLIQQAREVNEYMPTHVADIVLQELNAAGKVPRESTILVLGLTYKPNVPDVRTSAIHGTITRLQGFDVTVTGFDPCGDVDEMTDEFEIPIQETPSFGDVDGIVMATPHDWFADLDFRWIAMEMAPEPFFVDVDGTFEDDMPNGLRYRRL